MIPKSSFANTLKAGDFNKKKNAFFHKKMFPISFNYFLCQIKFKWVKREIDREIQTIKV